MNLGFSFFFTSVFLGVGLAMDAFSVSLANGLNEPAMKQKKMCGIAGVFAIFQFAMPMIGWICVSTIARLLGVFEKCIPIGCVMDERICSGIYFATAFKKFRNKGKLTEFGYTIFTYSNRRTCYTALLYHCIQL